MFKENFFKKNDMIAFKIDKFDEENIIPYTTDYMVGIIREIND